MPILSFLARALVLNLVYKKLPLNPKLKAILWPFVMRSFAAGGRK